MNSTRYYSTLLVIFSIFLFSSFVLAQGGSWMTKTDMPTARCALSASVAYEKIYAIGGSPYNLGSPYNTVEEYNPTTDSWTTKTNMPNARLLHCASTVNGKIYVIGGDVGGTATKKLDVYDPLTDSWTTNYSDMPTRRAAMCSEVVDGKIYVFGGTREPNFPSLKVMEKYDPATDTWTTEANMLTGRYCFASSVVDGKIYAIGGQGSSSSISTVEVYDPSIGIWTTMQGNMSIAKTDHCASPVNGIIYAIGGYHALSIVEAYDPIADIWNGMTNMITGRCQSGIGVVNGKIYVIGGQGSNSQGLDNVEEYTPPITSVENKVVNSIASLVLHQNYPNPFNPTTTIEFSLPRTEFVTLKIFNILGEEVAVLVAERLLAGRYKYEWDASTVASGVYFYKLWVSNPSGKTGNFDQTRKMLLLK